MASKYKNLRCPGCDGTLEYSKDKKVWICIYCGNEIRREEEYDGLYTIKNVVKQVLVDLAYGRMDSAKKNLVECEKIGSDYIGTLIAGISQKVFSLITPGACPPGETRSLFGQVKRQYERLKVIDEGISAEEEALYEAFEGNGDAFGVLLLVFDTLGAKTHLDFVSEFFDASTVYSVSLNAKLLNYAFKNQKTEMMDQIFANSDNINCRDALFLLLPSYGDCKKKQRAICDLISKAHLQQDDYKKVNEYLTNTQDSIGTKIVLYTSAVQYHAAPSVQTVMKYILSDESITESQIREVLSAFAETHPKDSELYELVDEIYTKHSGCAANYEMDILMGGTLFLKPSEKTVRAMLSRNDWSVEERAAMLKKSEQCGLDARSNNGILTEILLRNQENTDVRLALIREMLQYVETISTNTLTEYILNCSLDGERKPEALGELLTLDLNMSFFRQVLNQYMQNSGDSAEVKKKISQLLSDQGLVVDSHVLVDMACQAGEDDYMEKVDFIQKALQNGTRLDYNALSIYMERVAPDQYRSELISLLHSPATRITDKALANYCLYAQEEFDIKLQNTLVFAEQNGKAFGSSSCEISHLNHTVQCNLFQAYVLLAEDSAAVIGTMVTAMKNSGAQLNPNMIVDGRAVKFKKYVSDQKDRLSPMTLTLCKENRVFSMFF